jgi:hypothetical protein
LINCWHVLASEKSFQINEQHSVFNKGGHLLLADGLTRLSIVHRVRLPGRVFAQGNGE